MNDTLQPVLKDRYMEIDQETYWTSREFQAKKESAPREPARDFQQF